MTFRLKASLLFHYIFICCSYAGVDVLEKAPNSEVWVKSALVNKFALTFLPLESKPGKRLVYKGTVTFQKAIEVAEPTMEATRVSFAGSALNIESLSFEDKVKVKFTDKSEQEIKISVAETQFRMFNDQCKNFLINTKVSPTDKAAKIPSFPMGVSCDKYEDKIILVVSMPAEIEGGESSLVEGGGKGESWKFYELPSTAREDGVIGGIKFVAKSVELNLSLQNIRLKKQDDDSKKDLVSKDNSFFQLMAFGVGSKSLSFDAGAVSSAASGIALDAYFLTKPLFSQLQLATSYSTAIVSTKDENNITFSDFAGFLGYSFQLGRSRLMPFGFGKLVDFLHKSTQTRLQATLAGVGLDYRFDLNKSAIVFNFEYGAFAAKGISSQIRYQMGYQYLILEKSKIALGLFYDSQNFKAVNSTGEGRTFKEGNILIKTILNSY